MPLPELKGDKDQAPQEHIIIVPLDALASRRTIYGLATDDEALDAILKEHGKWLGGLDDSDDPRLNRLGGLRRDVTVSLSLKAQNGRAKSLKKK